MSETHVCVNQAKIEFMIKEQERMQNDINNVVKDQTDTWKTVTRIDINMDNAMTTLSKLEKMIEKMAGEPAQNWNLVKTKVITFVVGAGLTVCVGLGGLAIWVLNQSK